MLQSCDSSDGANTIPGEGMDIGEIKHFQRSDELTIREHGTSNAVAARQDQRSKIWTAENGTDDVIGDTAVGEIDGSEGVSRRASQSFHRFDG